MMHPARATRLNEVIPVDGILSTTKRPRTMAANSRMEPGMSRSPFSIPSSAGMA